MTTTKKERCRIPQYNIEGKAMEAFLGPLESKVLEIIWAYDKLPITVRETYVILNENSPIAYTTVMSTMNRLNEKGFLNRKVEKGKGGLLYTYWPSMEKEAFEKIRCYGGRKLPC